MHKTYVKLKYIGFMQRVPLPRPDPVSIVEKKKRLLSKLYIYNY